MHRNVQHILSNLNFHHRVNARLLADVIVHTDAVSHVLFVAITATGAAGELAARREQDSSSWSVGWMASDLH